MRFRNALLPREFSSMSLKHIQTLTFAVLFPVINSIFAATTLWDLGVFSLELFTSLVIRLWLVFGGALLILMLFQALFPSLFNSDKFFFQLTIHVVIVVSMGIILSPPEAPPFQLNENGKFVMARVLIVLELVVYLTVLRILSQQKQAFDAIVLQKETELNVLRSQSNPHFLFNTLNLITSEITENPENAKEIVFDLSDLMRTNLKLAKNSYTTIKEELKLVELYLTLQQKRFKNRLTFSIDVEPEAKTRLIPALLLQPVVENTIKYAVAPYKANAQISIKVTINERSLQIVFKDTGPVFDDTQLQEGDGFRILRNTLHLRYKDQCDLSLKSTTQGGVFTLMIPAHHLEKEHA